MRGRSLPPPEAALQHGVFSYRQARDAGYSPYQIRRRLDDGRWVAVLGQAMAETGTAMTVAAMTWAVALVVGVGGVVSHITAARLHGLRVPDDREVHAIVDRDRHITVPGLRTHRMDVPESELAFIDGVLVTDLLRTVVDCILWLSAEHGRDLVTDALRRRLFTTHELRSRLLAQPQRHGLKRGWQVMRDVAADAHSEAEVKLHRILRQASLVGWVANSAVFDADGLIGYVDVLFECGKLAVEVDGSAHHSDAESFQRDRSRQNRLVAAGYRVLRFTWDDIVHRPDEVRDRIAAMLSA